MRVEIDARQIEKLAKDLERAKKTAFPYATRDALNGAVFEARRIWGDEIRKTFVTRNTFTAGWALQVTKATGTDTRRMQSVVGSTADYMALQEAGGDVRGRSGHRPIPGPTAAGQPAGTQRTRVVRMTNRLRAIQAAKAGRSGRSRKQQNAIAIAIARRTGKRFALLVRPSGGLGLFALSGGRRRAKTRLVWDLSRRSAHVPAHPTLGPTLRVMQPRMAAHYQAALVKQLKRHHVLGY